MSKTVPKHMGFILDGNRRWAKAHSLPTLEGHKRGAEVFKTIALAAFNRGIEHVSAYVFSTENWSRTEKEVSYLMNLVLKAVERYLDEFNERGIKIVILGRRDGLRAKVLQAIQHAEEKTTGNATGTLALCFNYGGQEEIVDAAKKLLSKGIDAAKLTTETFAKALYAPELPPLDLIIRSSGEQRLSNFMLWRAAYAELYFTDKHWPDFTEADLDVALAEYAKRQRRFGQ